MKRAIALGVVLASMGITGCSSGSSGSKPACTNLSGLYAVTFSHTQTDDPAVCPLPTPFEAVLSPTDPSGFPGCQVVSTDTNPCSASVEVTCPLTVNSFAGQSVRIIVADTDASGDTITGSVQAAITYDNGQGQCNASWDFVETRTHQ